MNDTTLKPDSDDWHPKIKNVVYHGMDWSCAGLGSSLIILKFRIRRINSTFLFLCYSYSRVMARQLNVLYGNLTPENAIRNLTSIVQTGSLLTTYYDFSVDTIYTANARGDKESGPDDAYDRPFVKVNVGKFFQEQPPV